MMNKTSTHVWQKWFKKIVFPFRFPVPEKVFDSWYDTLDTASRNLYLASLPYFWFNKAPFVERVCETFLILLLGYILHCFAYWLAKNKSKFSVQKKKRK